MPTVIIEPVEPQVEVTRPSVAEPVPRRLYVRAKDIETHGTTGGCPGCRAWARSGKAQTHSEQCRQRITEAIRAAGDGEQRLRAQEQRCDEYFAEVLRKSDEARGSKRRAEGEADDGERADRREDDGRGTKREAPEVIDCAKNVAVARLSTLASSSPFVAGAPASSRDTLAQGEDSTMTAKREIEVGAQVQMEIGEIIKEMRNSQEVFMVEACQSPEVDLDEGWGDDVDLLGAADGNSYLAEFLDDRTGKPLDPKKVREAREEELRELERRVFEVVDIQECWDKKGKDPIPVRWVDVDKGFGVHRSRLVAKDFKPRSKVGDTEGLFAAMPPLEAVKLLVAQAAAESSGVQRRKIMFIDIGKAHLFGKMETDEYVALPPERHQAGKCARLIFTLYGMRVAATNWEKEYTRTMVGLGFQQGRASSVAFYHPERRVRIVVHGDDFIIEGEEEDLWWVHDELKQKYIVKMRGILGPEDSDAKEVVVLNRVLSWEGGTFKYEADPRHAEKMLRDMEMEDCNPAATPGTKPGRHDEPDETEIDSGRHRTYRSVVARGNFLAQDRPDIRFAVKELCRRMSAPRECDWQALKRLCRYLKGRPRVTQTILIGGECKPDLEVFVTKGMPDRWAEASGSGVDVLVDSDWAGCRETRRSTSGGCILFRGVCLKVWSTTQNHLALSSGEAEYYAAVKGGSEGLFLQNLCSDLGISVGVRVHTDSSACKGMCNRDGLGKVRHLDLQYLWLQQAVRSGRISLLKVSGAWNPADLMTKYLGFHDIESKLSRLGMRFEEGRSTIVDQI